MVGGLMVGWLCCVTIGVSLRVPTYRKIGEGRFFQQQNKINHDGKVWIDQINPMPPYQHCNWIVFEHLQIVCDNVIYSVLKTHYFIIIEIAGVLQPNLASKA
jgi:hypothetical protein